MQQYKVNTLTSTLTPEASLNSRITTEFSVTTTLIKVATTSATLTQDASVAYRI